jgi:hypothetical protein
MILEDPNMLLCSELEAFKSKLHKKTFALKQLKQQQLRQSAGQQTSLENHHHPRLSKAIKTAAFSSPRKALLPAHYFPFSGSFYSPSNAADAASAALLQPGLPDFDQQCYQLSKLVEAEDQVDQVHDHNCCISHTNSSSGCSGRGVGSGSSADLADHHHHIHHHHHHHHHVESLGAVTSTTPTSTSSATMTEAASASESAMMMCNNGKPLAADGVVTASRLQSSYYGKLAEVRSLGPYSELQSHLVQIHVVQTMKISHSLIL